jgi:signal transduction histidine kinase
LSSLVEQLTAHAKERGVTLRLALPSLANLHLTGDGERLRQVFANLIENAIKYTLAGGEVVVQVEGRGDRMTVIVGDTGVGIAPEHLPHLFERFYRVDSARTRTTGGFGLGLAIAQAIVQAHGGRIQVQSIVNQGTIFTVTLPH